MVCIGQWPSGSIRFILMDGAGDEEAPLLATNVDLQGATLALEDKKEERLRKRCKQPPSVNEREIVKADEAPKERPKSKAKSKASGKPPPKKKRKVKAQQVEAIHDENEQEEGEDSMGSDHTEDDHVDDDKENEKGPGKAKAKAKAKGKFRDQSKSKKFNEIWDSLPGNVKVHFNSLKRHEATTFIHDTISREKGRLIHNEAAMFSLVNSREQKQKGKEMMNGYIIEDHLGYHV